MALTQITTGGLDDNINIGSNTLKIDSTNNRVGIGTAAPGHNLEVKGSFPDFAIVDSDTTNDKFRILHNGGGTQLMVDPNNVGPNASYLLVSVDGSERMRINSSGHVGIGTTNPNSKLTLSTGDKIFVPTGETLNFGHTTGSVNTERMRIDSSGRLLVGTTTANGSMTVNMGTDKNISFSGGVSEVGSVPALQATNTSGSSLASMGFRATDLRFATGSAERMRIDSSGRLLLGTTTEGSGNADNLTVADSGHSGITIRSGTSSHGSIYFSDATSGGGEYDGYIEYEHANQRFNFGTAGNTRMRIDSSGNVGVGHTNPSAFGKFVVSGTGNLVNLNASSGAASLKFYENGSGRFNLDTLNGSVGLAFKNGSSEFARIDSSGRLLVGASSTRNKWNNQTIGANLLQVERAGDANAAAISITANSGTTNNTSAVSAAARLLLGRTRGTSVGSNQGIANGDILGDVSFQGMDGSEFVEAAAIQAFVDGVPSANDMPGRLVFKTTTDGSSAPSAHMIINRNGECRIGHGDSDPVSTDMVHSIQDPNLGAVTSNLARLVMQERAGNWISFKSGSGTHYGTISQNGSGVSYGSNSDYRLKDNVQNFTGGINLVKQLRPVTFNWNELSGNSDTTSTQRGFIAHEVQAVEPTAVTGEKDEMDRYGDCYDAEGRKTQTNVFERQAKEGETWTFQSEEIRDQQLDPAKLVPILTAALQEAIAKIETLETKVAALEAAE